MAWIDVKYEISPRSYLIVCRIRVKQEFLWHYDLDFGNLSFIDQYVGDECNVKNLIFWIKMRNKQYESLDFKNEFNYVTQPYNVSKNKVLPILKTLDKFLIVGFYDER